jgi:hypothetical protein
MAKMSFKKPTDSAPETNSAAAVVDTAPATDAIAAIVEETQGESVTTAVAVREPSEVTAPAPFGDEDIPMEDVTLPRLNIVQKVGELSDNFEHGAIIFNNDQVLPRPVKVLVLGFAKKRFVEKVEGGGRGMIVDSEAEVVQAGGTLDYNEAKATDKPLFQRLATALLLIECPEGVDKLNFPHEYNGKNYAVGVWNMKGTAYTNGAKIIFTARKLGALRGAAGYRSAFWTTDTKLTKRENNSYYIPVLKLSEVTTAEFRDWITNSVVGF